MESGRDVWGGALTLFISAGRDGQKAGASMEVAPGLMSDELSWPRGRSCRRESFYHDRTIR